MGVKVNDRDASGQGNRFTGLLAAGASEVNVLDFRLGLDGLPVLRLAGPPVQKECGVTLLR